jgi:hypothetical protein
MKDVLQELIDLLALERIEHNLFRGQSRDNGGQAVFGGQVLGQALMAAGRTVDPAHQVHSLHGYFLRAGDKTQPIVYDVDRIRDGASFTTRRVVAIQHGQAIFHMSASFQVEEPGFDHQDAMPEVPPPRGSPFRTRACAEGGRPPAPLDAGPGHRRAAHRGAPRHPREPPGAHGRPPVAGGLVPGGAPPHDAPRSDLAEPGHAGGQHRSRHVVSPALPHG